MMPQTTEVSEFLQIIGPSNKLINDKTNRTQYQTTDTNSKESTGEGK
jgi:hypothetical protein